MRECPVLEMCKQLQRGTCVCSRLPRPWGQRLWDGARCPGQLSAAQGRGWRQWVLGLRSWGTPGLRALAPGQRDSGLFSGETAVGPGRNPTFAGTPCHPLATAVPGRLPGRSTPGIRLFIRQHLDSKNKCMVFIFPQSNMLSDSIKCSF